MYRQNCALAESDFELIDSLPASQFQYTDSSISGGQTYEFHVTGYNVIGGESTQSQSFKVTPIQVPSGMTAPTRVTHDLNSITVQWVAPTDDGKSEVTRYLLYAKPDYQASYTVVFAGLALSYRVQLL